MVDIDFCLNCKFFDNFTPFLRRDRRHQGLCRRNAPTPLPADEFSHYGEFTGWWPVVNLWDYCGCHEPAVEDREDAVWRLVVEHLDRESPTEARERRKKNRVDVNAAKGSRSWGVTFTDGGKLLGRVGFDNPVTSETAGSVIAELSRKPWIDDSLLGRAVRKINELLRLQESYRRDPTGPN